MHFWEIIKIGHGATSRWAFLPPSFALNELNIETFKLLFLNVIERFALKIYFLTNNCL
jgi:hypothetical protein